MTDKQIEELEKELKRLLDDDRERSFAKEYIINGGNAYQAAQKAGYKKSTAGYAKQWLTETLINSEKKRHLKFKPKLKEAIQTILDKNSLEETVDMAEVLKFLSSVLRGKEKETVLRMVGVGCQDTTEIPVDIKTRMRAAEIFCRIYGMFHDKIDVSGAIPVVISGDDKLED